MINNTIIKYNANIDRIEAILKSVKDMGISMTEFEVAYKEITDGVDSRITNLGVIDYTQKDTVNNIYQYGIDSTNKLLVDLDKYNEYYQAINKCYYIQGSQNLIELNEMELDLIVKDIITLLKTINEFDGLAENDESMIEKLYDFVYSLIKTEYSYKGSSTLLSYCKNNDVDSYYINKNMFKEIESLKESRQDITKITSILIKNVSLNSTSSVIDEELIQVISSFNNRNKNSEELLNALSTLSRELDNIDTKLIGLTTVKNDYINNNKEEKERNKSIKSRSIGEVIKLALPVTVAVLVLAGVHVGVTVLAKGRVYKTTIETLSDSAETTTQYIDYIPKVTVNGEADGDVVIIDKKQQWVRKETDKKDVIEYERLVERTVIGDVLYSDLEDYLNVEPYDVSFNYEKSEYTETWSNNGSAATFDEINSPESETEIIRQTQDTEDHKAGNFTNVPTLIFANFMLLMMDCMVLMFLDLVTSDYGCYNGVIERLMGIKSELDRMKNSKFDAKKWANRILSLDEEIKNLIQKNEEFKSKYFELLSNPKYKMILEDYESKIKFLNEHLANIDKGLKLILSKKV